ncbi:hypothetical protein DFH06DRAFT_1478347, partial [Mycena polygramma]
MNRANTRLRLRFSTVESHPREMLPNRRVDQKRSLLQEKTSVEESTTRVNCPILTLPAELTSEIFILCVPGEHIPSRRVAPLLWGYICREWRRIAYGDPRLWSALKITGWYSDGLKAFVRDWILRAGNLPLFFI